MAKTPKKAKAAKADEPVAEVKESIEDAFEEADDLDENIRIKLLSAACDPVPVFVNGRGTLKLRVGEQHTISEAVRDALDASDAQYEVIK